MLIVKFLEIKCAKICDFKPFSFFHYNSDSLLYNLWTQLLNWFRPISRHQTSAKHIICWSLLVRIVQFDFSRKMRSKFIKKIYCLLNKFTKRDDAIMNEYLIFSGNLLKRCLQVYVDIVIAYLYVSLYILDLLVSIRMSDNCCYVVNQSHLLILVHLDWLIDRLRIC